MTDQELIRELAEKVMGWELTNRRAMGWGDGPDVYLTGEDPDDINSSPTFQGFDPLNEDKHAFMLVDALNQTDFYLEKAGLNWSALFIATQSHACDLDRHRAICLACLKVVSA